MPTARGAGEFEPEPGCEPVVPFGAGGRSLPQAVATAVALLGVVGACARLGAPYLFAFVSVVVLLALFELLDALRRKGHSLSIPFGLACGLALLVVAYLQRPELFGAVAVATAVGALALSLRPGRAPEATTGAAWTMLAVVWVGGGGAGAVSILVLHGGVSLLVVMILVVSASDVAAFFAGRSLGRHKLAPSVSPKKTWEGLAGGFVGALSAGAALGAAVDVLGPWRGLGFGAVCGALGPLGDLAESLVKREVGIKDSGRLLPGHGGFLDRLDAMVLCAPVLYAYLRLMS